MLNQLSGGVVTEFLRLWFGHWFIGSPFSGLLVIVRALRISYLYVKSLFSLLPYVRGSTEVGHFPGDLLMLAHLLTFTSGFESFIVL